MSNKKSLNCIGNIVVVPIGVGTSLSKYVAMCHKILQKYPIKTKLHSNGTNVEGDFDSITQAIKEFHHTLHDIGVPRIHTELSIGTRNDRVQTMKDKIDSVENKLK
ncbi:mth1187 family thiaminee-binding protein [Anaeramoeba ignava]|uniref:Mth1187 family thiaminee-binding protein n=1 Tax=Anaeramoeba ignava TaxID=1746090 RepID=A0A9Q0RD21_ANAIG|nr:mth1187 family thiaminee-binding protein [Anaeramoeba ignava]